MHGREKSDPAIVVMKPANKAVLAAAELVERRAGAGGNARQQSTRRTQTRARVTQALDRVRQAARLRKKERFTALLHHVSVDTLQTAFYALKRKAAPGVDGMTWQEYETGLEPRLEALHNRIHRGAYRPQPARRTYIPKADGRQRPLAIAALEDKIVQGAAVMVLNAIFEEDFLGFSYGFRPGRGTHDALDALVVAINTRKVNYILDADIRNLVLPHFVCCAGSSGMENASAEQLEAGTTVHAPLQHFQPVDLASAGLVVHGRSRAA
ncbi:MAG: reverse transcriptase domain-containing protein [Rhodopila sp.]